MRRASIAGMVLFCLALSGAVCQAQGDDFQFESRGRRDPFVPLIGRERPSVVKLADATSAEDVRLEGIAIGAKGTKSAILNGEMVRELAKVGEVEVKEISKKSVKIAMGGKIYNLSLSEEGGKSE